MIQEAFKQINLNSGQEPFYNNFPGISPGTPPPHVPIPNFDQPNNEQEIPKSSLRSHFPGEEITSVDEVLKMEEISKMTPVKKLEEIVSMTPLKSVQEVKAMYELTDEQADMLRMLNRGTSGHGKQESETPNWKTGSANRSLRRARRRRRRM
eukprot:TRINITY_DN217_c0_g1_i9.p1 TRINITY_DN217_c0_g1~~TRINITY_DN217_c0_g1_i9.p1  ORF type:complete len:152 (-),score=33.07 TRINITY_DN217_c0_g1_i9:182-637(-)